EGGLGSPETGLMGLVGLTGLRTADRRIPHATASRLVLIATSRPRRRLAAVARPEARRRVARDRHPRQVPGRRAEGPLARPLRHGLRWAGGQRRQGFLAGSCTLRRADEPG